MNFSGRWKANLATSRFAPVAGPPPHEIVVDIDHQESRVSQSMLFTSAAGKEQLIYRFRTDGTEAVNVVRGAEVRTRAHWEQEELIIESSMETPARQFRFRDCWSIAPDGTLVMEHRDDDLSGQRVVFDRS